MRVQDLLQPTSHAWRLEWHNADRNNRIQRFGSQILSMADALSRVIPNGDCRLSRNSPWTGDIRVWWMNGINRIAEVAITPSPVSDTNWKVAGVGDFNRDGKPDLIWQRDGTGEVAVWFMNGTSLISGQFFNPSQVSDLQWKIRNR